MNGQQSEKLRHPPMLDEIDDTPDEVFAGYGISKEAYRERQTMRLARAEASPKAGKVAPDFELERLSPQGDRTGNYTKLSDLHGKPVALVFGATAGCLRCPGLLVGSG